MYHAANFNSMKNDLRFIDWPQILDSCDTISCWKWFLNTINPVNSKYTPTRKPNSSKKRSIRMNKDALSKLKLKNKLSHRYLRTNNPQDYETYAKCRNQSKQTCRKFKVEYEKSLSREVKTNPEAFFKYASSKLNYSRTIPNLKDGNKTISQNYKKEKKHLTCFSQVYLRKRQTYYQNSILPVGILLIRSPFLSIS